MNTLDLSDVVYQLPIKFDFNRVMAEINTHVIPYMEKHTGVISTATITNKPGTPLEKWFTSNNRNMEYALDVDTGKKLSRSDWKFNSGYSGPWKDNVQGVYPDGTLDSEMTEYHPVMQGGEIERISRLIEKRFHISPMRCRMSRVYGSYEQELHSDAHTPWRVHIALKGGPGCVWYFKDVDKDASAVWSQPVGSIYLVRTGNVLHSVRVSPGSVRWNLFYHIRECDLVGNYYTFL